MRSRRASIGAVLVALNTTALAALRTLPPSPAPLAEMASASPPSALPPGSAAPPSVHPTRPTEPLRPSATSGPALNADQEAVYPVSLPVTTIGRALDNAISLLDPAVSRQQARLLLEDDGWWIENISQRNPLWVGGVKVAPGARERVLPGQTLQLGSSRLQLLAPLQATPRASQSAVQQATGDRAGRFPYNPLGPGVTLQFALRGRLSRSARWALLAVAVVMFLASAILTLDIAALAGQAALASGGLRQELTALAIPIAPALGVALVVGALDRYEREPPVMMIAAFLWGAIIAIPPTLYIERALDGALMSLFGALPGAASAGGMLWQAAGQAASAGGVEELVKGAGLLLLLLVLRDEFDNVTDGVIYGALIGAGFAMVENIVYFAVTPHAALGFLIVGRIALGWLSHSSFTALFGAGLGYIRETRDRRAGWLAPLGGLLGAIALHTYFDFIAFSAGAISAAGQSARFGALGRLGGALPLVTTLAAYTPLFLTALALLSITLQALRREAAIIRAYLASETLTGVVTPDEYLLAQDARLRSAVEREYGLRFGLRAYLLARGLYQTETGLAFRKWHVEMGDPPKRSERQPEDAYRERIPRLRRALAHAVGV
ncbi:MAG TPA: PrsW family glutamic-type intramembrane protease [Ktedonobacterales bacterium]|nr:PrsW family glutamic-type intramembrane protease [Ktedonobacterales bacterium]